MFLETGGVEVRETLRGDRRPTSCPGFYLRSPPRPPFRNEHGHEVGWGHAPRVVRLAFLSQISNILVVFLAWLASKNRLA